MHMTWGGNSPFKYMKRINHLVISAKNETKHKYLLQDIKIKLSKFKPEKRILKAVVKKMVTHKGALTRLPVVFSAETLTARVQ